MALNLGNLMGNALGGLGASSLANQPVNNVNYSPQQLQQYMNQITGATEDLEGRKVRYLKLQDRIKSLSTVEPQKLSFPVPDIVHTLTGWRGWRVANGKLEALGVRGTWEPKKAAKAACNKNAHPAPSFDCTCGYWSFKSLDLLTQALEGYADSVTVLGTVEMWGKIVECENGFRSEYAYPGELWLLKPDLEYLSWTYDIPVRVSDSTAQSAEKEKYPLNATDHS